MTALLDIDPDQIATYVRTVFRSASPGGTVSLRAFDEEDANAPAWMVQPIVLGDSLDPLISAAVSAAHHAAMVKKKIVFCPPTCAFSNPTNARYLSRRVLQKLPHAHIVLGRWASAAAGQSRAGRHWPRLRLVGGTMGALVIDCDAGDCKSRNPCDRCGVAGGVRRFVPAAATDLAAHHL